MTRADHPHGMCNRCCFHRYDEVAVVASRKALPARSMDRVTLLPKATFDSASFCCRCRTVVLRYPGLPEAEEKSHGLPFPPPLLLHEFPAALPAAPEAK